MRLAIWLYVPLGLAAWAWRGFVRDASVWRAPGPDAGDWGVAGSLFAGIALGLAVVIGTRAWSHVSASGEALSRELGEQIGRLSLGQSTLLALMSGTAEELFFRGALQPEIGLVGASLCFGLAHFVPRRGLIVWSLFAVVMGGLLGALYDLSGSLLAPVAAHIVVNGLNLPHLSRRYG